MVGVAGVSLLWILVGRENTGNDSPILGALTQSVAEGFKSCVYEQFLPTVMLAAQDTSTPYLLQKQITDIMPLYGYASEYREIASLEGMEGQEILPGDGTPGQSGMPVENGTLGQSQMTNAQGVAGGQSQVMGADGQPADEVSQAAAGQGQMENGDSDEYWRQEGMALEEWMLVENQGFIPHTLQNPIALSELSDYETLVNRFYTIDASTMAGSDQLNAKVLGEKDLTIEKRIDGPQILIYHTHSQEGFADSVPGDVSTTIVGVGEELASILTTRYGYQVLHHTGQYDVESRNDAYSVSLPAIETILEENPTIEVIIDLHRDQMPEGTKLVQDLDGRPTARFMFFNGLSRTKNTGNIAYLYNEYQEENLAFSFQMHMAAEQYYPGLARKIYLKGYRYNMHLKPRTLLIELGAQNNTVEEAMNACDPIAHILNMVLSGEE